MSRHHGKRRAAAGAGGKFYDFLDPLDKAVAAVLSENNLRVTYPSGASNQFPGARGIIPIEKDVYVEFSGAVVSTAIIFGVGSLADDLAEGGSGGMTFETNGDGGSGYSFTGTLIVNGVSVGALPDGPFGVGEIIGIAYDFTAGEVYLRDSTGYIAGQDPVTRTGGLPLNNITGLDPYIICQCQSPSDSMRYNSGEAGFSFPVPTGFQAGHFI